MLKNIHHIAIAVEDIEAGKRFWHDVLGLPLAQIKRVEQEGVDVAFLPVGESEIELLQPFEANGIAKFLQKRGAGIHHICFEVDDIEAMMVRLVSAEITLITPTPQTTSDGTKYAFVHPKSTGGVLIELYEKW